MQGFFKLGAFHYQLLPCLHLVSQFRRSENLVHNKIVVCFLMGLWTTQVVQQPFKDMLFFKFGLKVEIVSRFGEFLINQLCSRYLAFNRSFQE